MFAVRETIRLIGWIREIRVNHPKNPHESGRIQEALA
jgi:hypothetical protein